MADAGLPAAPAAQLHDRHPGGAVRLRGAGIHRAGGLPDVARTRHADGKPGCATLTDRGGWLWQSMSCHPSRPIRRSLRRSAILPAERADDLARCVLEIAKVAAHVSTVAYAIVNRSDWGWRPAS